MSRYEFTDILLNEPQLEALYDLTNGETKVPHPRDVKGLYLHKWLSEAQVGWDPDLDTYFLQCGEFLRDDDCEDLVWWVGTGFGEVPTFNALTHVICSAFNFMVPFKFADIIEKTYG
jgi:hypothetical protein